MVLLLEYGPSRPTANLSNSALLVYISCRLLKQTDDPVSIRGGKLAFVGDASSALSAIGPMKLDHVGINYMSTVQRKPIFKVEEDCQVWLTFTAHGGIAERDFVAHNHFQFIITLDTNKGPLTFGPIHSFESLQ